ncbi:hypothetical protein AVEN_246075-1 [Araneus ventricosus]|uniref:Uncharacterized protein n=1 Tax=Araneus ventricosus TaxID=182803 RepID=A0A4Y2MNN2_ARAVE|nr:hypothetical protein AVEN_246075-1 [Araneus ventricosus]
MGLWTVFYESLRLLFEDEAPPKKKQKHGEGKIEERMIYWVLNLSTLNCNLGRRIMRQYSGGRTDKTFTIEKNDKESTINIDRVKPAFFENSQSSAPTTASPPVTAPSSMQSVPEPSPSSPASPSNSSPPPYVTRSGRRVHFNPRYL